MSTTTVRLPLNSASDSRCGTLSRNLEHLIATQKLDLKVLSQKSGISITNLNNIRRNVANPTLETLEALANYFGLPVSELIESDLSENRNSTSYKLVAIPLLELDELEAFAKGKWKQNHSIAISVPSHSQEMPRIAIKLNNNAFSPLYEKDTLFILNLEITPQDGDIVAIKIHESPFMIRRIFFVGNKLRIYCPNLLDSNAITEDKRNIKIIGVAEKIIKER